MFNKLDDIMNTNENILENRLAGIVDEEEYEKDSKIHRRTNAAINEKLKANLSKRF